MDEHRDALNYGFLIVLILNLIELKLSLFFLSFEHEMSCVSKALFHVFFKLMMLVLRMVIVKL